MATLPLGPNVTIAGHHPCGLWALNKPGGVRSHPNGDRPDPKALLTVPYSASGEHYRDGACDWHLLNRLDAPTSGLVLIAESADIARRVRDLFEAQMVKKTYYALVKGRPDVRQALWEDRLRVTKGPAGARAERGGNQVAVTAMKVVESSRRPPFLSLLELQPRTGRTHQLRVQCAARHLPIVGDATYGDFRFNREFAARTGTKRLFLHAARVSFQFEWQGQKVGFRATAQLPETFQSALVS